MAASPRYAYLHGFASSANSHKGTELRQRLATIKIDLELPDLNRPSFRELTIDAALEAIDELDAAGEPDAHGQRPRWRFVGSSMGGFLAARWAQLHPERVDRLILLCPGFGLPERWPEILGAEVFAQWRKAGALHMPDGQGKMVAVHWGFVESAERQPKFPEVPCPTTIIHGRADEVVPVAVSREYVEHMRGVTNPPPLELIEVDDDHGLVASLDLIEHRCRTWLVKHTYHWDFHGDEGRGTAEHFERHLREFLDREGICGGETGVASQFEGHHETWLRIDVVHEPVIRRALRPQRKT